MMSTTVPLAIISDGLAYFSSLVREYVKIPPADHYKVCLLGHRVCRNPSYICDLLHCFGAPH